MPTLDCMSEAPLRTKDFVELENEFGAHNYKPLDVVIERAQGVWVYDVEGKKYLDCLASYSAVNQGHCHPKILKTMLDQAHKVVLPYIGRPVVLPDYGPYFSENPLLFVH